MTPLTVSRRDWLATQGTRLKVVEIDMETPTGEKRLQAVGVTGHVPVVVLIDGQRPCGRRAAGWRGTFKFQGMATPRHQPQDAVGEDEEAEDGQCNRE